MKMFNRFENEEKIYNLLEKVTIALVIILIAFSATALYIEVPKVKEAVALAVTKKPETFTELYFENHLNLPSKVTIGEKYFFNFTIHNLEHKSMEYPYEVYIDIDGEKEIIEKKSLTLDHDNSVTVKETLAVSTATRSAVVVNLINKKQDIRFLIEGK